MASSWPTARWQTLSADTRLVRVCHVHGSVLGIDVSALWGKDTSLSATSILPLVIPSVFYYLAVSILSRI